MKNYKRHYKQLNFWGDLITSEEVLNRVRQRIGAEIIKEKVNHYIDECLKSGGNPELGRDWEIL